MRLSALFPTTLLVACAGEEDPSGEADAPADTGTRAPTADTGPEVGPPSVQAASCTLDPEHPLRARCEVVMDQPGPTQIDLTLPDGSVRPYLSDDPSVTTHTLLLWGLTADTTYSWSAGPITDTLTTGPLPAPLQALDITTTGTTDAFDAFLRPITCEGTHYLVMINPHGEVVWYEENSLWSSGMHAYEWSEADRSVMVASFDRFEEIGVDGSKLLVLERGVDFEHTLHHDVARWGPYTYLLMEYRVDQLWVDGVYVFEGDTPIGELRLSDHYVVEGDMGDWSHANGLESGDDGELTLSLRMFDTVLGIDGDPSSPGFLDITWSAGGTPQSLPGLTYEPGPGPLDTFSGQHNASRHGDQLWLFDNLSQSLSRAARYRLTEAGEVVHEASWSFDAACPVQGGAVPVGDGVLGTCVAATDIRYFEDGTPEAVWAIDVQCGQAPGVGMNRAIPVHVW